MLLQPVSFARPVAASSSDFDRALSGFVSESNSAEGRALKTRGIQRLRQLNPALSAEHVRAIASFVNSSNGLEGRGMKLDGLARIMQVRPDLSPRAIQVMARGVDASETLEGRSCKMRGFEQLFRACPDLREDVLSEMSALVCGSNGTEGYAVKFGSLARMLRTQPKLSAEFVRALRGLVDESNSVAGRELKLRNVEAMLQKQPGLTPAMLRSAAGYVNESNSLEGRGLKLQSMVTLLGRDPNLEAAQVDAIASGVNACPGMASRRVAVAGYEQVLQTAPRTSPDILREMGRFLSAPATDAGRTEFTKMAVQVVQGDPQVTAGTFRHLRSAAAGAYTDADGSARAEVAYNDLLIARGVGKPVEELATLTPARAAQGANVSLPLNVMELLRGRPELKLSEENVATAHRQVTFYEQSLAGTTDQVIQGNYSRYSQLWEARRPALNSQIQLIGLGVGLAACIGMLLVPAVRSVAVLGMFGGVFLGSRVASKVMSKRLNHKIAEQIKSEIKPVKSYWEGQVASQQAQKVRVESYLAADLWQTLQTDPNRVPPGSNVKESDEAVVIGGVRIGRRRPDLKLPPAQGPQGFDSAGASGAAT